MHWDLRDEVCLMQWHPWFAWHPIRIGNRMYWLETVSRRLQFSVYDEWWEYTTGKATPGQACVRQDQASTSQGTCQSCHADECTERGGRGRGCELYVPAENKP